MGLPCERCDTSTVRAHLQQVLHDAWQEIRTIGSGLTRTIPFLHYITHTLPLCVGTKGLCLQSREPGVYIVGGPVPPQAPSPPPPPPDDDYNYDLPV